MVEPEDVSNEVVPSSATPPRHPEMEAQGSDENVVSNPESGEPSRTGRPGKEVVQEDTAATNKIHHSEFHVFPDRRFLFKMRVTPRDVVQGSLFIPAEIALHHFPPPPEIHEPSWEEKIRISILRNIHWIMTSTYNHKECGFVINSEWQEFSNMHNLEASDVLLFYKPFPHAKENHYLIICFRRDQESNTVPELKQANYLFQRELTDIDVNSMLSLQKEEVNFHFPAVRIPVETHNHQRLYFTDARNKDWCVTIKLFSENYMVVKGWDELVEEHKLEIGDVIRFYKPVWPFDSRHFLIQHVKRGEMAGSNDPTQPGTISARNECSGDGKGGESGGLRRYAGWTFSEICRINRIYRDWSKFVEDPHLKAKSRITFFTTEPSNKKRYLIGIEKTNKVATGPEETESPKPGKDNSDGDGDGDGDGGGGGSRDEKGNLD